MKAKPKADYDRIAELLSQWKFLAGVEYEGNAVALAKRLPIVQELHDLTKDLCWDEDEVVRRAKRAMRNHKQTPTPKKKK